MCSLVQLASAESMCVSASKTITEVEIAHPDELPEP
jgi:hypothetical protein